MPWRTGRKLAVTIYKDDVLQACAQTPEAAMEIVDAANSQERLPDNFIRMTEELSALRAELERLMGIMMAAKALTDAMETCHICEGQLLVDEGPAHCENCSCDCEDHEPPNCRSLYHLHNDLKRSLKQESGRIEKIDAMRAELERMKSAQRDAQAEGMSKRERLIREYGNSDAAKYLIGVIDVIRQDRASLRARLCQMENAKNSIADRDEDSLAELAQAAVIGKSAAEHRLAAVCRERDAMRRALEGWLRAFPGRWAQYGISERIAETRKALGIETHATQNGVELIRAERERQIKTEGFDSTHDNNHSAGELVAAASCYLRNSSIGWPWEFSWWKPRDTFHNLVRSGALIAAELDRLIRKQGGDATSKESKTTAIPPNEKDLNAAPSRTSGGAGAEVKP